MHLPISNVNGKSKIVNRILSSIHNSQFTIHWRRRRLGFTLIEILVVITIIGILVAASTVSYAQAQKKGRDGKRKADLKSIQQALELHYQSLGYYPPINWDGWTARISFTGNPEVKNALTPYLNPIPTDPKYSKVQFDYLYKRVSSNQYELVSILESNNDPDFGSYSYGAWGTYNYQVKNP